MKINPNKTVCATAEGIIISYRENYKYQFFDYQEKSQSLSPKPKYQTVTKPLFNKIQQRIYAQTVYGLNYFTTQQLAVMPKEQKQSIISRYTRVQKVLNRWKQEIANAAADRFLISLFPNSPVVKSMTTIQGHDDELIDTQTFKQLGLTQEKIALKLYENGLLPKDFFLLKA